MSELKPCPLILCNGKAKYVQPPMGDPAFISCTRCGMRLCSTMVDLGKHTLVEVWNTRPAKAEAIKALEDIKSLTEKAFVIGNDEAIGGIQDVANKALAALKEGR